MAKALTHTFTPEKLAELPSDKLRAVRENAVRYAASDLIQMCDDVIGRRTPAKSSQTRRSVRRASDDVVVGYHFVCGGNRGVSEDGNGQFRSGSWVVAETNVQDSLQHGAYLALHEARNLPSYRQGQITGYRLTPRSMISKDNVGIEFVVQETGSAYDWVGDATGEKGYRWRPRSEALTADGKGK
jgi:hypothetical protein